MATPSAAAALARVAQPDPQDERSPVPPAAGLLLLGGLLLGGAGVATGPPGLARRIVEALRDRLRPSGPAPEDAEDQRREEPGLPRLVPLTVLEGPVAGAGTRDASGASADGGRILPPT
jgi:hypothetical protein